MARATSGLMYQGNWKYTVLTPSSSAHSMNSYILPTVTCDTMQDNDSSPSQAPERLRSSMVRMLATVRPKVPLPRSASWSSPSPSRLTRRFRSRPMRSRSSSFRLNSRPLVHMLTVRGYRSSSSATSPKRLCIRGSPPQRNSLDRWAAVAASTSSTTATSSSVRCRWGLKSRKNPCSFHW